MNAATGSGALSFSGLRINGIRTDGFPEILKAVDGKKDFKITAQSVAGLAKSAIEGGNFSPGSLSVPFAINNGKARVSDVDMSGPGATVHAEATVDLASRTLDGTMNVTYKPGDDAINGGGTPAVALRYAGPLADPHRTIDAAELSNYLSLRAFEIQRRKVELLQAGVLQKQRLRREMDLQRFRGAERQRDEAIMKEELRRRAAGRAARDAAREEAAREEAARQKAESADKPAGGPPGKAVPDSPTPQPPAPRSPAPLGLPKLNLDPPPTVSPFN